MADAALAEVLRFLRATLANQGAAGLDDRQLLQQFSTGRDERAITVLVERHGPMILSVCRRVLGDAHQSEDAFQAAFLVLIRKSSSLTGLQSVGGWLHGVAYRIALKARAQTSLRRQRERKATLMKRSAEPLDELTMRELRSVLDAEIASLAEKYRGPVVLCHLEGKSYDQAARELGCTKITLSRRLTRARALLRRKLERRGITLTVAALAAALTEATKAAPLSALLTINTVKATTLMAAGNSVTGGAVSASALALAEDALTGMLLAKGKTMLVMLVLGLALGGGGIAVYGLHNSAAPIAPENAQAPSATAKAPGGIKKEDDDPLPAGSLIRFGTSRFRQGTPIASLSVSADGKLAAATSGGHIRGSVRVFDLATGLARAPVKTELSGLTEAVALSPDGRILATKEHFVIHFRDTLTGKELSSIDPDKANGGTLTSWLLFTPDGKSLAVGAASGKAIHLIDVATANVVRTFHHQNVVFAAAFSADGLLLAAGGYDSDGGKYYVRLWEVATGKELRRFAAGRSGTRSLAFSPDAKMLAGGGDDAQLRLWDVNNGTELHKLPPDGYRIRSVAFSPDGTTVAAAGDSLRLYEPATGKETVRIDRKASGLYFSADGKALLGAVMGSICRWDPATGRQLTPQAAGDSVVDQILVSPDNRRVITRGQEGDAHIWDAKTGAHERLLSVTWQRGIALGPDGRFLAWPVSDPKVTFKDPDNRNSTYTGSRIRLYEMGTGQFVDRFPGFEGDAQDLFFASKGSTLVMVDHRDGRVRVWDFATGKELHSFQALRADEKTKQHFVWHTVLAPDGSTLAVTYQSSSRGFNGSYSVRLWEVATGKELHELAGHKHYVHGMEFSPDSRTLVTGSDSLSTFVPQRPGGPDRQVFAWDGTTGRRVSAVAEGLPTSATAVAYAPDGWTFATAAPDGTISLWESATYTLRAAFRGHRDQVTSLAFTRDSKLLSGSVDTTVLAWDIRPPLGGARTPLVAAWDGLLAPEASVAFKAMGQLQGQPAEAVALLRDRLKVPRVNPQELALLIADLDNPQFAVRQKAVHSLEKLGESAEAALREVLEANPSLEARQRTEALLEKRRNDPEVPRKLRGIELLEWIGTPQARSVLEMLAQDSLDPRTGQAASAAVRRLTGKS